jgi:hypothetical protein
MSGPSIKYGFTNIDKNVDYSEEESELEGFEKSCPGNCCDHDCECDDCARCSRNGQDKEDAYSDAAAA